MAFTDSASGNPRDSEQPGSNDTPQEGPQGGQGRGMPPRPAGGPLLAALQRQLRGPQVSAAGPGNMADGLGKLKVAVDMLQAALGNFEPGTPQYKDILRALGRLSSHLPEQGNASGLQETHLMDLLRKGKQNPIMQALSGLIGGGGGGGPPGPQPPMPSTPLPGA
jgi:hypothetical protein